MNRALPLRMPHARVSLPSWLSIRTVAICLSLLLSAGLSSAFAANLLTNPGFEDGITGWNGVIRGSTVTLVSTPGEAHTGANCVQAYNATGWSSASQGDSRGGWGTGVTINVDSSKYYRLSAWVKVPGASTTPQAITLRYRFEPSGARVDVGQKTIATEDWTYLESGWIQPPAGDTYVSYWEVHSVANAVTFLVDDCGLDESGPLELNGKVVDSSNAGYDGATVSASSAGFASEIATTSGGGFYTLFVPSGTYSVSAGAPALKGKTTVTVNSSPTTAPDIVLGADPDYDTDLIFSAYSESIVPGGAWPAAYPAGMNLTRIGSPETAIIDGIQWEKNIDNNHNGPGWRFGTENLGPISVNGATAVAVIRMGDLRTPSNNWDSVIDVFYDRLVLGVRNDTGLVNVRRNGTLEFAPAGTELAEGQKAVIALVVQPDGNYKAYINGTEVMSVAPDPNTPEQNDMTSLTPGAEQFKHFINVASNDPDRWTAFNGYIGDVFLYQLALPDAKRQALETKMMEKFSIDTTIYTIEASAGAGGKISPSGTVKVPSGINKTFTITPDNLYQIDKVLVDGVDQGPVTSYTFVNVKANGHTIAASFKAMPSQTIYGKVTDGAEGILPATVYFSAVPGAVTNYLFRAKTIDLDGNYSIRIPQGTWYVTAAAGGYTTSAEVYPVTLTAAAPVQQNFTLVKQTSTKQPMLTGKGAGAARTNLDGTVGFAFNTGANAIEVSALGFVDWDLDGLLTEHTVGIWSDADHVIVAEATVPAGTGGTLTGDYRYATLPATARLEPNTVYVLGALVTLDGDKFPDSAAPAGLGQPDFLTVTGIVGRSGGTGYIEPQTVGAANQVFAAANLIGQTVPMPTVKGVVSDSFGKPIPNAIVQIGYGGPAYVTDAAGKYRIIGAPQGGAEELYADGVGYADYTASIDTSTADVTPLVKNVTLTSKLETGVIQNGGFELGLAGWSINGQQAGDTLSLVSPGFSGNNALKFTPGIGSSWTWPHQILDIVPGSVYTAYFKGYADASVGEWFPMVAFRNDAGEELKGWIAGEPGFDGWVHNPPKEWMQYLKFHTYSGDPIQPFVRITPPEGATKIDLWVGGVAGTSFNGASCYADDAVIDRVGPDATPGPYTTADVVQCLQWSLGGAALPAGYLTRYDVQAGGKVDLLDAQRIARKVAGLEANP